MDALKDKLKHIYIFGRASEKDWRRVLVVIFVAAIVAAVWSLSFFLDIKSKSESATSVLDQVHAQGGKTKGDELRDLVLRYELKSETYAELIGGAGLDQNTQSATSTTTLATSTAPAAASGLTSSSTSSPVTNLTSTSSVRASGAASTSVASSTNKTLSASATTSSGGQLVDPTR